MSNWEDRPLTELGYHDLERMALGFVLETETWPVFVEYVRSNHVSAEAHYWVEHPPDLTEIRRLYLQHSPDPVWRRLGEL
jgi:hypothetical protein